MHPCYILQLANAAQGSKPQPHTRVAQDTDHKQVVCKVRPGYRSCRWRGTRHDERAVALEEDARNEASEFADALVNVISPSALDGIMRFSSSASFFREVAVGIELFGRRCGRGGRHGGFGEAGDVGGREGGREMMGGNAIEGYIVERLHVGGGYTHAGRTGAVDRRIRIVWRGWGLCGVGVLGMGVGVLKTKGVGEGIWGGEIVIWGCTGAVWDKESPHGVSAARDDDGLGVGAGRGTVAGYVRGDGIGPTVTAGGSRRTDGSAPGP